MRARRPPTRAAVLEHDGAHATRCERIRSGYGSLLPSGHLIFFSDTDDPALDEELAGLVEVVTGYQDSLYYRIDGGG